MAEEELDVVALDVAPKSGFGKKKVIVILAFLVIVAVAVVAMFGADISGEEKSDASYSVVDKDATEDKQQLVMYNLSELKTTLKSNDENIAYVLRMRITFAFNNQKDVKNFEALLPRLTDAIITITSEATAAELIGAKGMYWLKEEILYRANLILAPLEIKNVSFRSFDVEKVIINPIIESGEN